MLFRVAICWCITSVLLFLASLAQAQEQCVEIFKIQETQQTESAETFVVLPKDASLLQHFEAVRSRMLDSTTMKEANQWMYETVSSANYILDAIAENVLFLKSQQQHLPPEAQKAIEQSSQVLLSLLEVRLEVPRQILQRAVMVRIQAEIEARIADMEAEKNRVPLGFLARETQDAERTFEKFPIGFNTKPGKESDNEVVEKQPIGFIHWDRKTLTDEPAEKRSIGFMNWGRSLESPASERRPMGFVDFDRNLKRDVPLNQIVFDLEKGDFNVVVPGYKLGF